MPSLYSAGVRVHLATAPLAETITPDVVIKKGEQATRQANEVEVKLKQTEFLDEEVVNFPGDEDGFNMNWLGGAPFLQVLAGGDAWKEDEAESEVEERRLSGAAMRSTRSGSRGFVDSVENAPENVGRRLSGQSARSMRSASRALPESNEDAPKASNAAPLSRAHPHTPAPATGPVTLRASPVLVETSEVDRRIPKALILHVMLTEKTFYQSLADGRPQHLKIDVFFNGQLSNCVIVHQRDVKNNVKPLHQVFAGTRVDFMVERPWVIVPPGQNVDGSLRQKTKAIRPEDRWQQICEELLKEAGERGLDEKGEMPPSAEFLKELANMAMPEGVADMQKPGGRNFGVVDVVVTAGTGRKLTDGVRYLRKPMRLADEKFAYELDLENEGDDKQVRRIHQDNGSPIDGVAGAMLIDGQDVYDEDQDAEGSSDPEYEMFLPGLKAHASLPPASQDAFTGGRIQPVPLTHPSSYSIPPSLAHELGPTIDPLSEAGNVAQRNKRDFSEFAADAQQITSEQRRQPLAPRQVYPSAHAPSTVSRSFPGPQFNLNQYDGFVHANPYQMPFADMMVGLDTFDPSLSAFDEPVSSPALHSSHDELTVPSFEPSYVGQLHGFRNASASFPPNSFTTPGIVPSQLRKVSFGQANVASFNPDAPPNETPSSVGSLVGGAFSEYGSAYNSSPLGSQLHGLFPPPPPHYVSPFMIAHNWPAPGPPPVVGMFSATKKVERSSSVGSGSIDGEQSRTGRMVKRLVIKGKVGEVILDHKFKTPRNMPIKRIPAPEEQTSNNRSSLHKSARKSVASSLTGKSSSAQPRRRSGRFAAIATPPPTSPGKTEQMVVQKDLGVKKRDSVVPEGTTVSGRTRSASTLPVMAAKPPTQPVDSLVGSNTRNGSQTTDAAQGASSRRTASNGILGVQGPKATKFVFDDPEELLRKKPAKHQSRSVSPMKVDPPMIEAAGPVKDVVKRPVDRALSEAVLDLNSSSPLSSVPDTPDLDSLNGRASMIGPAMLTLPPAAIPTPVTSVQTPASHPETAAVDALGRLPSVPASATMHLPGIPRVASQPAESPHPPTAVPSTNTILPPTTPSPTKNKDLSVITATTMLPPTTPSALKKKGPAIDYSPTRCLKLPRSPDRLATTDNPALNEDCSIQYAVGKTGMVKNGKRGEKVEVGVLRQIKCERQGLFSEESVVVGVRFFVAG